MYTHTDADDSICNVEQYYMQHCLRPDSDDSDDFVTRIRGGGWQGWHCEGQNYDFFIHT